MTSTVRRGLVRAFATAAAVAGLASDAAAQARVPWLPGELASYEVRFGNLRVGQGHMKVVGLDTVRGRQAYRTEFRVKGGIPLYRVNSIMDSWIDTRTLSSLRHIQNFEQGGSDRERHWEIFPERATYQHKGEPEQPSVSQPLDDGSFIYFIRTVPLVTGQTYTFNRYFRPDRNPVTVRVLRREKVTVPAGTFNAVVVQPIIRTKGIFGEDGQAEIWFSDDDRRIMLQMRSKLKFGSLNLFMTDYRPTG